MAVTYTVTEAGAGFGPFRYCHGTFTSALGDGNGETIGASTNGMNYIVFSEVTLDTGAISTPVPKKAYSSGTITWTVDDTFGLSGKFFVMGK